jgi:hypothetical protein
MVDKEIKEVKSMADTTINININMGMGIIVTRSTNRVFSINCKILQYFNILQSDSSIGTV